MLRSYDKAVLDFCALELAEEPVPLQFATPRWEFGSQPELQDKDIEDIAGEFHASVKLPSMAVQRMDWQPAVDRDSMANYRKIKWNHDLNMVAQSEHPRPFDISYQLDIWTKYRDDANFLVESTIIKFPRRYAWLTVNMGEPWGDKRFALRLDNIGDVSELEPGNDADPVMRMTIDMVLEAWLPLPYKAVRTVRRVVTDYDVVKQDGTFDARAFTKVYPNPDGSDDE